MKKVFFLPALFALILANVLVYSCQKENALAIVPAAVKEEAVADRAPCSQITITNGRGLSICGINPATYACTLCTDPAGAANIVTNSPVTHTLAGGVFSFTNLSPFPITVTVDFNCIGVPQMFTIPPFSTVIFKTATNGSGCCEAFVSSC